MFVLLGLWNSFEPERDASFFFFRLFMGFPWTRFSPLWAFFTFVRFSYFLFMGLGLGDSTISGNSLRLFSPFGGPLRKLASTMPHVGVEPRGADIEIGSVVATPLADGCPVMNVHPYHLLVAQTPVELSDFSVVEPGLVDDCDAGC